jgi:hypothetical protein
MRLKRLQLVIVIAVAKHLQIQEVYVMASGAHGLGNPLES